MESVTVIVSMMATSCEALAIFEQSSAFLGWYEVHNRVSGDTERWVSF